MQSVSHCKEISSEKNHEVSHIATRPPSWNAFNIDGIIKIYVQEMHSRMLCNDGVPFPNFNAIDCTKSIVISRSVAIFLLSLRSNGAKNYHDHRVNARER